MSVLGDDDSAQVNQAFERQPGSVRTGAEVGWGIQVRAGVGDQADATAERTAQHTLANGRGGLTTRITARYVRGYLAMGRGDLRFAEELLEDARGEGESMHDL
jgi:hypothetical protein